jgi:hypothetical protein
VTTTATTTDGSFASGKLSQSDCMIVSMKTREAPPHACPRCGSTDAVRIVYGYPTFELFEAEQRGEVSLGGCIVGDESPDYASCGCGAPLPWIADD